MMLRLTVVGSGVALLGAAVGCGDDAASSCNDTQGLTDEARRLRETMSYVSASPHADKTCENCQLFTAGQSAGACGSCTILPGQPVGAAAYCAQWVVRA